MRPDSPDGPPTPDGTPAVLLRWEDALALHPQNTALRLRLAEGYLDRAISQDGHVERPDHLSRGRFHADEALGDAPGDPRAVIVAMWAAALAEDTTAFDRLERHLKGLADHSGPPDQTLPRTAPPLGAAGLGRHPGGRLGHMSPQRRRLVRTALAFLALAVLVVLLWTLDAAR